MTPILIYNYRDTAEFQAAAVQMAQGGYYPISQSYTAGTKSHSTGLFIFGLIDLLFFIVPGILILLVFVIGFTWHGPASHGPIATRSQADRMPAR